MNQEIQWTFSDFNSCFGLFTGDSHRFEPRFNWNSFRNSITGLDQPYEPSRAKVFHMKTPIFRYLHQVMSKTIFGRGENDGVVRKMELYAL